MWLALFLTIIIVILIAAFATRHTEETAAHRADEIQNKYLTGEIEENALNGAATVRYNVDFHYEDYTDKDARDYRIYTFVKKYAALFWYSVCVMAGGLFFYLTKLKRPLSLLGNASARIAESELDFTLDYSGSDEMAKLCSAFEKMRNALDENNKRMLHMIDERKQLNDAYTHDLRTPIAVLKGYSDMLVKYLPENKLPPDEVLETVKTMSTHVSRLEQFVDSMNTVQKLEDLSIEKEDVASADFLGHLRESAAILCQGGNLSCAFEAPITDDTLHIDPAAVIQVYENLMGNAIRFAKSKVIISCTRGTGVFSISVTDDGKGFSEKDMAKASHPYYSGHGEKQAHHFGLGLHICRTLCEKHGGQLRLENASGMGAKVTAQFST
ncbi:MAG: HAMP domain-containing sensor histidine kinase [Syntrophomonadaceae bacterium]|nr:HAMP domain-containing sensor histidine kinase [Syntrophomonadaceae bacterium]